MHPSSRRHAMKSLSFFEIRGLRHAPSPKRWTVSVNVIQLFILLYAFMSLMDGLSIVSSTRWLLLCSVTTTSKARNGTPAPSVLARPTRAPW